MEKVFSRGPFQFQGKHNFSLVQTHILHNRGEWSFIFLNIFAEVGHFYLLWTIHAGIFKRVMGGGGNRFLELSRSQVYGIEPALPHKTKIFKAGIDFLSTADSCHHRLQRRQSAKLFLPVVCIGTPPTPHPLASVTSPPPPPPGSGGRGTLAGERGVGRVPISTRGHTLWYSLNIRTLWLPYLLRVGNVLTNGNRGVLPQHNTHNIWRRHFWNLKFFHTESMFLGINFPQRNHFLESVESSPGVLKSLKIRELWGLNLIKCTLLASFTRPNFRLNPNTKMLLSDTGKSPPPPSKDCNEEVESGRLQDLQLLA